MRTALLVLTVVCFAIAALSNSDWGWFGIEYDMQAYRTWLALGGGVFAASFFPWATWRERYDR